jgi:hypothetical protein
MLRFLKKLGCVAALALGLQPAFGFSLMGLLGNGGDSWQTAEIDYGTRGTIGGPKNIGEEFRWNTPDIYYAFDQNFLDYFGSNGVWTIEQGIGILNNLKPFSQYSANLTEVPLKTKKFNFRAQALHLYDLKSFALYLMMQEMGGAEPDRYVWTLRTRSCASCPVCSYHVISRNFDPITWQPTAYINGVLWTYYIVETCAGPPAAFTRPFSVDPQAPQNLPVLSTSLGSALGNYGLYLTGLTRDDVGGLRYSYRPDNINWEAMSRDSTLFYTNIAAGLQLLYTSNLTLLAYQAQTNNAAALNALYPSLGIVSTTNIYTNIWVTNLTAYLTNYPWEPYGTPAHTNYVTNRTLTVQTWYQHIFDNLYTPVRSNGVWRMVPLPDLRTHTGPYYLTVQTTYLTNYPGDPYGTPPRTNTVNTTYVTNAVVGEYFIMPTNFCDISLAYLQATLTNYNTNVVVTNTATTNTSGTISQVVIDYFTNHVFTYYGVDCVTTNVMLRKGIDKFTFHRANYDSLVGRFFAPITNLYSLVNVTNSLTVTNWYRRILSRPDFLFTARDTESSAIAALYTDSVGNFNDANANAGLAGPGNIEPGNMVITFNKVGPVLLNVYNTNFLQGGLSQDASTTNFCWGTFDGSTNAPVIYPSGTSIANLEAQILFQIVTAFLADGKVGRAYPPTQLQAAGGVLPYSNWTWNYGFPILPPGLSLSPSGVISGTPTLPGTFGFRVNVTGGDSRTITRSLSITIKP